MPRSAPCTDCGTVMLLGPGSRPEPTCRPCGDNITLQALGHRDHWACHLCPTLVPSHPGNGPWSPSIDHLVPLSAGGEHRWNNVALAHRQCNSERGTRPLVGGGGVDTQPHRPHADVGSPGTELEFAL